MQPFVDDLRVILIEILQGNCSPARLTRLVNACHKMAIACLKMKTRVTSFQTVQFGLDISDFAYDAIADLFRRDGTGRWVVFEGYFKTIESINIKTESELLHELRRLVFSSVNQRIILSYRENDPGLARLIRNIKLALKNHIDATLVVHHGEQAIAVTGGNALNESRSDIPPELLEIEFRSEAAGVNTIKDLLTVLVKVLDRQDNYRKTYSVTGAALLFRSFYLSEYPDDEVSDGENSIRNDDLSVVIEKSVSRVMARQGKGYVDKGKLVDADEQLLKQILIDILMAEYSNKCNPGRSYYEILKVYKPALSKTLYREQYRHRVEYLVKTSREEMIRLMKRELNITR
ncbi:MAG: hypothetical protein V1799_18320 [bacterium]